MKKNSCPACGAPIPHASSECGYCGSSISYSDEASEFLLQARKCPGCGSMNAPDAIHCSNCAVRILEACSNCGTLISVQSKHCTRCGSVHHSKKTLESDLPNISKAVSLSRANQFSDANDIFEKLEKSLQDSPDFYSAWITNYQKWAMSMDSDSTMHSFSAAYRHKARELLAIAKEKFPDHPSVKEAEKVVASGLQIKKTKKSGCFVATEVYGNEDCYQVRILRYWRDNNLSRYSLGRTFTRTYYFFGPFISKWIHNRPVSRIVTRRALDLFVRIIPSYSP